MTHYYQIAEYTNNNHSSEYYSFVFSIEFLHGKMTATLRGKMTEFLHGKMTATLRGKMTATLHGKMTVTLHWKMTVTADHLLTASSLVYQCSAVLAVYKIARSRYNVCF